VESLAQLALFQERHQRDAQAKILFRHLWSTRREFFRVFLAGTDLQIALGYLRLLERNKVGERMLEVAHEALMEQGSHPELVRLRARAYALCGHADSAQAVYPDLPDLPDRREVKA
jgi:hypothetical protein